MTAADAPHPQADFFSAYIDTMHLAMRSIASDRLESCVSLVEQAHAKGRKVLVAGNGGSAAMASHVCVDFVKVAGVRAVNFNEADLITCFANDYGYENWVSRALEAYADADDLVILISSSG
ncbi:MAG: SIS domain-containing protein, partial [Gammaproteobacteria bacterium]